MSEKTYGLFPSKRAAKIAAERENAGASIIWLPAFSVEETDFSASADLLDYDWLIFADVFAAEIFTEKLKREDFDLYELDNVRIASVGEEVSDVLRFEQVHSDVIPPTAATEEKIHEAVADYAGDLRGLKFLVLKAEETEDDLEKLLEAAGAAVSFVAVYRLKINDAERVPRLKALIKGGAVDEMIFDSPQEKAAFRVIFGFEVSSF